MTFQEEIAELRSRIAAARAERDAGQATGMLENYFDACRRLEALERQLEGLRQQGLRAFAGQDAMADLGIEFRDGAYHVGRRRHLRLADAVSDAQRLRAWQRRAA
jgi:hypothetical protein